MASRALVIPCAAKASNAWAMICVPVPRPWQLISTMKKPIITQTFDPCNLDAGETALTKLWQLAIKDQDVAALAEQDMMIVHCYAGTKDTAMFAERYSGCAIEVKSLGGDKTVDMPFDVTYGGTRTVGTAAIADGVATFTKATA